jgi:hypothetical protein
MILQTRTIGRRKMKMKRRMMTRMNTGFDCLGGNQVDKNVIYLVPAPWTGLFLWQETFVCRRLSCQ